MADEPQSKSGTIGRISALIGAIAALITALVAFLRLPGDTVSLVTKIILYFVALAIAVGMFVFAVESVVPGKDEDSFTKTLGGIGVLGALALIIYGLWTIIKFVFFSEPT